MTKLDWNASLLLYQFHKDEKNFEKIDDVFKEHNVKDAKKITSKEELRSINFSEIVKYLNSFGIKKVPAKDVFTALKILFPNTKVGVLHLEQCIFSPNGKVFNTYKPCVVSINEKKELDDLVKPLYTEEINYENDDEWGFEKPESAKINIKTIGDGFFVFEELRLFEQFCEYNFCQAEGASTFTEIFFLIPREKLHTDILKSIFSNWEKGAYKVSDETFLAGKSKEYLTPQQQRQEFISALKNQKEHSKIVLNLDRPFSETQLLLAVYYYESLKYYSVNGLALSDNQLRITLSLQAEFKNLLKDNKENTPKEEILTWGANWKLIWNSRSPRIEFDRQVVTPASKGVRSRYFDVMRELLDRNGEILPLWRIEELLKYDSESLKKGDTPHNAISKLKNKAGAYFIKNKRGEGYYLEKV